MNSVKVITRLTELAYIVKAILTLVKCCKLEEFLKAKEKRVFMSSPSRALGVLYGNHQSCNKYLCSC
jgi:hypothetical protein